LYFFVKSIKKFIVIYLIAVYLHSLFQSNQIINNMNNRNLIIGAAVGLVALVAYIFYSNSSHPSTGDTRSKLSNDGTSQSATPQNAAAGQPIQLDPNAKPTSVPVTQPIVQPVNTAQNPATTAPATDPASATSISFVSDKYDFGTLKEGKKVTHVYKFKNTGTKPLLITNAQASCGCTVPEWPKEPIAPGGAGELKATFDSKGKMGKQTKSITVTANTIPAQTIITLSGEVIADPNAPAPAGGH
jgi:hypothetical protein